LGHRVKIIEDKVTVYPPHAICKADVPEIFSSLPAEWAEGIETVRLCAAQKYTQAKVHYSEWDQTLTITSRGLSKEQTLRAILTELAGKAFGVKLARFRKIQERDAARVRRAIAPLVEDILPRLSRKKVWLDEKPSRR